MGHLSETSAIEVVDGLSDFRLVVHDEGTLADNRLFDRFTRQYHQCAVAIRTNFDLRAGALEADDLRLFRLFAAIDRHFSGQRRNHRGMAFRQVNGDVGVTVEPHIPDIHRAERACRPSRACEGARDNPHARHAVST